MKLHLKSVVFKTNDLKRTIDFFVTHLGLNIKESSAKHFVIQWKTIRVLFIYSETDLSPELYFAHYQSEPKGIINPELTLLTDPNGIKVIVAS